MSYSFNSDRHIHLLGGTPLIGTTTALDVLGKNLTWWAAELAAVECLESGEKIENIRSEYEEAITSGNKKKSIDALQKKYPLFKKARFAHYNNKNKSADKGIDLHSVVEQYIKNEIAGLPQFPITDDRIVKFVEWSKINVKRFLFSELHCYSKALHCGGIADFGHIDMEDNFFLDDVKSSREPYFNHWAQLGGYDLQISENGGYTPEGKKIFDLSGKEFKGHAIFCAGYDLGKPFFNYETARVRRAFSYCANLYKEKMFFEKETDK